MILSAQRVVPKGSAPGTTAINAYRYVQPTTLDDQTAIVRFEGDRTLVWRHEEAPPPGNRVVSFLDVSLPSNATRTEFELAMEQLLRPGSRPPRSPLVIGDGRIAFQFQLASQFCATPDGWRNELAALLEAALGA